MICDVRLRMRGLRMNNNLLGMTLIACLLLASCGPNDTTTGKRSQPESAGEHETKSRNSPSAVVPHFWFDYNGQPDPGRRVWVHVDDSTWTEVYPNGNESRYKIGDRTTVQGMRGTTVRKVAGDPQETWTLNDGSFEVFIPDKDNPRLNLAFRHYQNGRWTEWQLLALIHRIE